MLANLTPFIPLSFKGEGEEIYRERFHPSLTLLNYPLRKSLLERLHPSLTLLNYPLRKSLLERLYPSLTLLNCPLRKSLLERGFTPSLFSSPPSLAKGRGSGG